MRRMGRSTKYPESMAYISNDERRRQFVQAAIAVIREHGLGDATTRRIAEEAKAPLGALHYCFRGKDELYEAVMQELGVAGLESLADCVTPGMGVAAAAAAMGRTLAKWTLGRYADHLTEYEIHIWGMRSHKYAHIPANTYREWLDTVAELLESARRSDEPTYDTAAIARMIIAFEDGYGFQDQFLGEEAMAENFERAVKILTRSIEAGDFTVGRPRARRSKSAKS
jgi:TetR/AcrR family transcriptional regulator, regulator of biofilm formation and stress response